MKTLNRRDFPGAQYPERIIQFGEGNFLRAFVDWQIDLLNEHTDLNSGVVVVRPIETSFPPSLSTQDGLYTTIIRGLNEKGEAVSDARLIRSVNREISVYSEYDEFLKLAHNPEMRFVFSNTTEAGISYHAGDKFDDAPAVSYPAKLTRLLFERFSHFNGALDKGWIIIPCELIDYNGDALRELCCAMRKSGHCQKHLFNGWIRLTASVLRWWTVSLPVIRAMKWLNWKKNWVITMVFSTPLNTFTCL